MVLAQNMCACKVSKFVREFITENVTDVGECERLMNLWNSKENSTALRRNLRRFVPATTPVTPHRVVSRYLYFCDEERPQIIAANPGMNIRDVTTELGVRWRRFKEAPDAERMQALTTRFEADRQRYIAEKTGKEEEDDDDEVSSSAPVNKRLKPSSLATRNAYISFCKEKRSVDPKLTLRDLGGMWKAYKKQQEVA